jgi:hypothetical protein
MRTKTFVSFVMGLQITVYSAHHNLNLTIISANHHVIIIV